MSGHSPNSWHEMLTEWAARCAPPESTLLIYLNKKDLTNYCYVVNFLFLCAFYGRLMTLENQFPATLLSSNLY